MSGESVSASKSGSSACQVIYPRPLPPGSKIRLSSTDTAISRGNAIPQVEQVEPPRVVHPEFMVEKGFPTDPRTESEPLASKEDILSWIKQEEPPGKGKWELERETNPVLGYDDSVMIKSEEQNRWERSSLPLPGRGEVSFYDPKPEVRCEMQSSPPEEPTTHPLQKLEEPPQSKRVGCDLEASQPKPCLKREPFSCVGGRGGLAGEDQQGPPVPSCGEGTVLTLEPRTQQTAEPYPCTEHKSGSDNQPLAQAVGGPHACSLCPKSFRLKTSLLIHQRTHTVGKSDSAFVCPDCGCGFSHQGQLTRHQASHSDRPHQCSECHKAFNRKSSLVVHQKTHRERPRPFQCPQCSKTFIRKQHLDDHTRTHTGEKPYQCPECEKRFAEKSKLTNHYRIHTGERPYQCGQCDKRFVRAHHLVKHQSSVHQAGAKLYSCQECGQNFTHAQAFLSHQASHTNGERRHRCTECLKTFARRKYLLEHQRMHTGENPYSCPHCGKRFRYKQSLKQHLRMHGDQQRPVPSNQQATVLGSSLEKPPLFPASASNET